MTRGATAVFAVVIGTALAACSTTGPATTNTGPVGGHSTTITLSSVLYVGPYYLSNYYFNPNPDTVSAGSTITFTSGSITHSVHFLTNNPATIDSIPAGVNLDAQRTFPTAGTYTFFCSIHNFYGTVVAQ